MEGREVLGSERQRQRMHSGTAGLTSPGCVTPAARNAAMLSVVPPHTMQLRGRPLRSAASAVTGATGAPGATTSRGSRCANGCKTGVGVTETLCSKHEATRQLVTACMCESLLLLLPPNPRPFTAPCPDPKVSQAHLAGQPLWVAFRRRVIAQLQRVVVVAHPPLAMQQPCHPVCGRGWLVGRVAECSMPRGITCCCSS